MNDKLTLKNGTDVMDKCLDAALKEQRSMAHSAIDMDDWAKAQEILAVAKRNITLIDDLKSKFAEYKKAVRAAEDIIGGKGAPEKAPENINDAAIDVPEIAYPEIAAPEIAAPEIADDSDGPDKANEEFLVRLEELINEFPFAMAVCNEAAGIGDSFTYDAAEAERMKKPAKLSNSLWVETAISKSESEELIKALRVYGEKSS